MKKLRNIIFKLTLIIFSFSVNAQVYDIGVDFKKEGFVRFINYEKNLAVIDFVINKEISTELVSFAPTIALSDLRFGMEMIFEGEYFRKTKNTVINKVIFKRDYDKTIKIKHGRLDAIENDYAVVEGCKVKLSSGKIIKGVNGYNKIFYSINQLLLGDIVEIKGRYKPDGYIYADSFCVEPDIETKDDIEAKSGKLDYVHKAFYSSWQSKPTRKKKLGKKILGFTITNDEALQEYVHNLGMRLVPEHIKEKINYMFIVVNDEEFNAGVYPNGLALVRTGLLKKMQNEAQLAAVLGHEIAHSIYEHGAKRLRNFNRAIENTKNLNRGTNTILTVNNLVSKYGDNTSSIDPELLSLLLNEFPTSIIEKKLSDFSVEEELQADRVGLYLLAKAGYDPREASMVWRNVFEEEGNGEIPMSSYFDNTVNIASKNRNTTIYDIMKIILSTKIENNALQSSQTHPYTLDRFKDLNKMTYYFWSSNELLNNGIKGYDSWYPFWQKLQRKR